MKRLALVLVVGVVSIFAASQDAQANTPTPVPETVPEPPLTVPGTEEAGNDPDLTIQTVASQELVQESFEANNDGSVGTGSIHAAPTPDPQVIGGGVPANWPPCAEYQDPEPGPDGITYSGSCLVRYVCGGERVDDLYNGQRSSTDATGYYRQFLSEMIGYIGGDVGTELGPVNAESVNDFLLAQGLGPQPSVESLPIFYFCRREDSLTIDLFPVTDPPSAVNLFPTFGWDTTFGNEYDINLARQNLLDDLLEKIGLYNPEPAAIPPLDEGKTIVHFPTWLWLENPLEEVVVWSESDINTIHIDMRATMDRIEWEFADDLVVTCSVSDMVPYQGEPVHDPWEDRPPCHHIFRQLGTYALSVTIFYDIEERTIYRQSTLVPFEPVPWQAHPTNPVADLTSVVGDIGVYEIASVVVPTEGSSG